MIRDPEIHMDPKNTTPPPYIRPMNEPHTPISESEMNPNMHTENPASSSKNTLLTLASILVLAGIVGVTLYLYIQNKTNKTAIKALPNQQVSNVKKDASIPKNYVPKTVEEKRMAANLKKYGVACRRFTSIEEALKTPEIACVLDLSGQKLSSLPDGLDKLTDLQQLNLSNNVFTSVPSELLKIQSLMLINLGNNKIVSVGKLVLPTDKTQNVKRVLTIDLKNNNIDSATQKEIKDNNPDITFSF